MEPLTERYPPGAPEQPRRPFAAPPERPKDRYWLHLLLFALTLLSTILTGGQLANRILHYEQADVWFYLFGSEGFTGLPINGRFVADGLWFGLSLLLFLTVHEFGHYFAARRHRVDTSLPYYIPVPLVGFGTLGAVIRIREPIPTMRKLFDIGAAGPIAGFVVALGLLLAAFATLPPPDYLLTQPEHEQLKAAIAATGDFPKTMPVGRPQETFVVGNTLLYWMLSQLFENVPPMYEMYHYPLLFAGWLGLFFTALNLLPVGQLDGGHIVYALLGRKWHGRLARAFFVLLLISGSMGFVQDVVPMIYEEHAWAGELSWFGLAALLYFFLSRVFDGDYRIVAPVLLGIIACVVGAQLAGGALLEFGYWGWFIWCLLIVLVIKVDHPPVAFPEPLSPGRRVLAILSLVVFVLCFSFKPLYLV